MAQLIKKNELDETFCFLKKFDSSIYDAFIEFIQINHLLSFENSFFLYYCALIERISSAYLKLKGSSLPFNFTTVTPSMSNAVHDGKTSALFYHLGLELDVFEFANQRALFQKHGSNRTGTNEPTDQLKDKINRPYLIKMLVFFYINSVNEVYSENNIMLTDDALLSMLIMSDDLENSSQNVKLIKDQLSSFKCKKEKIHVVCSLSNAQFKGRKDIVSVSFENNPYHTKVGYRAFENCSSIEKVDFENVSSIGDWAFSNCYNLKEIDLKKVSFIGKGAFHGCRLEKITLSWPMRMAEWALDNALANGCLVFFRGSKEYWDKYVEIGPMTRKALEQNIKFLK